MRSKNLSTRPENGKPSGKKHRTACSQQTPSVVVRNGLAVMPAQPVRRPVPSINLDATHAFADIILPAPGQLIYFLLVAVLAVVKMYSQTAALLPSDEPKLV